MSSLPAFAINGRFYGQAVTGVQRYAREVIGEIDVILAARGEWARLVVPPRVDTAPDFAAIEVSRADGADGHVWEQVVLPLRAETPLLNLCNAAPVALRRQVVCIHDANVFDAPFSYSRAFRTVYQLLLPLLARRSAAVTSVSHFSAGRLARYTGIDRNAITVLPNGHEHVFRWNSAASRLAVSSNGLGGRPFVFLLGSRAEHKNASFILRQAAALDALGIDLVVAGGTAEIFLHTQAIHAPNIRQLGFVTDDDLGWLYTYALCLAFPSRSEGFGLPLVEAMALGCPIVSSNTSCMPEICGDATLLADPDDPVRWQAHFHDLMASADLRSELRERGLERVKAFSWHRSAQAYLDLLTRL